MAAGESGVSARARLLARVALVCALAAVAVLLAVTGRGGLLILLIGLAGLAATAAGTWWLLAHRGVVRWAGALLALGAPVAVLVLNARAGFWPTALGALLLWGAALACARSALRRVEQPHGMHAVARPRPLHPVLIMNPKSGGGKVDRFGLVEKAERLDAIVVLLDASPTTDVAALAHRAVAEGADLLGVAGGDGTQALVAAVAAEHDLPFLVVSAGTRNHFAMDLGLDRADPSRCLDALTDGEELRVDLGMVAGHAFVNTVSFGAYARIVQSPEYREAKAGTALDALPGLLLADSAGRLDAHADGTRLESQQALLVSNNPYTAAVDPITAARRPRLDLGTLGVLGVRVDSAAQAAELALRGTQASGMNALTARKVVVHSDMATVPVAVDGEALRLPTPVTCTIQPGALRVRVPRDRPGVPATSPQLDWRRVITLAFDRPRPPPSAEVRLTESAEGSADA